MKLVLLGWSSRGLRCPDVDIDLQAAEKTPFAVSLLQMPNGTGKTTTLNMIRAALDGTATNWSEDKVRSFRRAHSTESEGSFILRLAVNGEYLTFELRLRFEAGIAQYTTQFGSHNVQRHDPPTSVARFLRPEFVQLFIFDGEFANRLLDAKSAEAQKAIESLFQLHLFDDLTAAGEKYLRSELKAIGTQKKSSAAVRQLERDRDAAFQKHAQLEASREKAQQELDESALRIASLEEKTEALKVRTTELEEARTRTATALENSSKLAEEALVDLLAILRQPMLVSPTFETELGELVDGLERLRLPADTASQWFEELADESNADCVCGRPLGVTERNHIRTLKDSYLGTEVHAVLNAIKGEVANSLRAQESLDVRAGEELAESLKKARATNAQKGKDETAHANAITELAANGTDEEQVIYQEIIELRQKNLTRQALIEQLDASTGKRSIRAAKEEFLARDHELHQATQTATLNSKIKALKEVLRSAKESADAQLRSAVKDTCNDRLRTILSNDPLELESIGSCLKLAGQDEASMGQTLAVGYTFLVTLLRDGNHSFPLVVDSPAGPLDHSVRTQVARLIPEMSEQFLAFTISTEREAFVPSLAACVEEERGEQVQFLTLVRKTEGTAALLKDAPADHTTETESAALVHGRNFFDSFNLENEETES